MKGIILCEQSQKVCKAFRKLGHEFYSNDLIECTGGHPEWHLQMDCLEAIDLMEWDFIGMHPVCTKMALSGNRTYAPGKPKHLERLEAVEWTIKLWQKAISKAGRVYMENPMGAMNCDLRLPRPQIIQPYFFGDEAQKTTCLWLYGLPRLFHAKQDDLFATKTHVDRGQMTVFASGKVMPTWYANSASTNSEKNRTIRSKTFDGIANAIAQQWG